MVGASVKRLISFQFLPTGDPSSPRLSVNCVVMLTRSFKAVSDGDGGSQVLLGQKTHMTSNKCTSVQENVCE